MQFRKRSRIVVHRWETLRNVLIKFTHNTIKNISVKVDNVKEDKFQGQSEVDGVKLELVGRPGGQPAQPEELEKAFEHDGGEKEKTMREKHQDGNF